MNPTWLEHLKKAGAVFEDNAVAHFGNPEAELRASAADTTLMDLSQYGLLAVTGEDAQTFLQGQFTNDVSQVSVHQGQYSALCTPKGRMLASFFLWREADGYRLQLPLTMQEGFRKRLAMYVLRSKVQIADRSDDSVRLGIAGPRAAEILGHHGISLPVNDRGIIASEDITLIRFGDSRFEVVTTADKGIALWNTLAADCNPVGSQHWDWLDIQAGIPTILPTTREEFVPQMVNFEALGGVSFKKGCYTGQEVVARAQHIGQVKRRLYLAHVGSGEIPQPGTPLYYPGSEEGASGKIVNAEASPEGGWDVLAVIPVAAASGEVHLHDQQGPLLEIRALPYSL
ncbi:MAG: folate-binding protein YgfZ [Sulfuricellaceae bacterium]